jgi:hypothetical protein
MARTTPAQKPRGEQSSTLSTGFDEAGAIIIVNLGSADLARICDPDMGCAGLPCQAERLHEALCTPIFRPLFPIITDDPKLRPGAGEA